MNSLLQEIRRLRSDLVTKTKSAHESSSETGTGDSIHEKVPPATSLTESEKTQLALRLSTISLPGAHSCPTEQVPKRNVSQDRNDNNVRHNDSLLDLGINYDSSKLVSLEHQPIEELQIIMKSFQKMTLKEDMDHVNAKRRRQIICLRVSLLIVILLLILLWVVFGVIKRS